jgi:hypothetical protein
MLPEDESRPYPPEELFGLKETDHLALRPRRDNLQIAVVAFVLMLVFGLLAIFFRGRLHRELDWTHPRDAAGHAEPAGRSQAH